MEVVIGESSVSGTTSAPPSKSYTHRALFASGFADGATIVNPLDSTDTRATGRAVESFGGRVEWREDGTAAVWGFDGDPSSPDDAIDCGNSGTTMRIAIAIAALTQGTTELVGDASLSRRPHGPLLEAINDLGGVAKSAPGDGTPPVAVSGPIRGGRVSMPGDVSSQFVTALLFAGAITVEGISVQLETALKSKPYVTMTLDILDDFSIDGRETPFGYLVEGDQQYRPPPGGYYVPGDFSSLSYLLAAGALVGDESVTIEGVEPSAQGDQAIVSILSRMGAEVRWNQENGVITVDQGPLSGIEVSVANTPDLLPTIAVLGAAADETTRIEDVEHVRYKETDRVGAMAAELQKFGVDVEERENELIVNGSASTLTGTEVNARGDHRLAMALSVAGLVAEGRTTIVGAHHVNVSFPNFFDTLEDIGATVIDRGMTLDG